ncbi:hypothetical protein GCM10027569_08870 [Flindersiella endophytica]
MRGIWNSRLAPRLTAGSVSGLAAVRLCKEEMDTYRRFPVLDPCYRSSSCRPAGRANARGRCSSRYNGLAAPA